MNDQLVQKIRQCPSLPSLPAIAIQVLELAQKRDVDISEIAKLISKDPALSSKILRTVNSSFYGRSQTISTVSHALVILGLNAVKTLVLGFSLVSNLSKTRGKGFKYVAYWRRSLYAATAARTLAARNHVVQAEECFLSALLMDIGMLVLDQVVGEAYTQLCEGITTHGKLLDAEAKTLGMTHPQVARVLADLWHLPPILSEPMVHHHDPEAVTDPATRKITELVNLAGRCADIFVDEKPAEAISDVRRLCAERMHMSEADCDAMLEEINQRTREAAPLFEVALANVSYEEILREANAALVELTLTSQQQAVTLQVQNQALKVQATTDSLTGLANRAHFDQFINDRFSSALMLYRPLAMVLMDVDLFKNVNDHYGHQSGDAVLRTLGKMLRMIARVQDLAARYGGEEMALILPETSRRTAVGIAEKLRRMISARPMQVGKELIQVTGSIGVAVHEPGGPFREAAHLIRAADLAVYAAKKSGRNCVRVFCIKGQTEAAA
jgi:diguanylate cyclase (GGDEF)-like protein